MSPKLMIVVVWHVALQRGGQASRTWLDVADCSLIPMFLQVFLIASIFWGCGLALSTAAVVSGRGLPRRRYSRIGVAGLWLLPVFLTLLLWAIPEYSGSAERNQLRFDASAACLLTPTAWIWPMLIGLIVNMFAFMYISLSLRRRFHSSTSERSVVSKLSLRFLFYIVGWMVCWGMSLGTGVVEQFRDCPEPWMRVLQGNYRLSQRFVFVG
jgi:7 transmembrane receptor (Secretin family)